ncbi:agamous-like MADS-box protein AGL11 [Magnolia sinica]|uniref:agamous-like MADS-box protein AGL11 n=1 Tax=Magnolia sinica TaxID=86752 RepID=UPI0026581E93|nr:agamous-like MADS-box protein AGL11 [Magnolia sinica]
MCRRKAATKFIEDPKSRNVTFNKRKQGLKKKAYEFSTLCGVDTCMICFKEYDGDGPSKPLTWPNEATEVERIIKRYKRVSDEEKGKRKVDLSSYLENKKKKMEEELVRLHRGNGKMTMYPWWDDQLDNWPEESLRELANQLDAKMEDVRQRIALLKDNQRFLQLTEEVEVSKLSVQLQPLPISSIELPDHDYSALEFLHNPAVFESSFIPNMSSGEKFNYNAHDFLHNPTTFESNFMPHKSSGREFNYDADEFLHNPAVLNSSFMPNAFSGGKLYCGADSLPSLPFTNLGVGMLPFINPGFGMLQNNNEVVAYNAFHEEGCFHGPQHFGPTNPLLYQRLLMHPQTDHLYHGFSDFHEFDVRPRND